MQLVKKFCKGFSKELKLQNFGFEYSRVELFYRSQWQKNELSITYLLYRWLLALFFLSVYLVCMVLQFSGGKFFIYMTNWGFGLCTIAQLIAAVQVTRWHFDLQNVRSLVSESGNKARTSRSLKAYWMLFNMALSLALIISTVYWVFLHGKMNKPMRFPTISVITHGLNSVFMLVDFLVIAFPLRLLHVVYCMSCAIVFFIFTVIYHYCGGTDEFGNHYVYPILDWTKPVRCVVTFAGIFLLYVIYWLLLFGVYKLRRVFNRAFSVVWTPHAVGLI